MDTPNGEKPANGDLSPVTENTSLAPTTTGGGVPPTPLRPAAQLDPDPEEYEDGKMLRMTFLEHLEEMRSRILMALYGFGAVFLGCLFFAYKIWDIVSAPALDALAKIGANPPFAQDCRR